MTAPLAIPRPIIQDGLIPLGYGIVLGLALGDDTFGVEVQRAPDDGAGDPDTANAEIVAHLVPGVEIYADLLLENDDDWRHYRARHVRQGWTEGSWTSWVRAKPIEVTRIPTRMPELPIVTHLAVTWASDGDAIVSADANRLATKVYITVGPSVPADPTPSSNHGVIDLSSTSFVTTSISTIGVGKATYVKGIAEGPDGSLGPVNVLRTRRGFSFNRPPHCQATATRVGETVTVNLTVQDYSHAASLIQYQIREDDGTLGSWTTWTGGTGSPGTDDVLTRSKTVTASQGKDSEFEWRVRYDNESTGVDDYKGSTINIGNLEEVEGKPLEIGWAELIPATNNENYRVQAFGGRFETNGSDIVTAYAPITLAVGCVMTDITARAYRFTTDDQVTVQIRDIDDSGATLAVVTVTFTSGTGWQDLTGTMNEEILSTRRYVFSLVMDPDAASPPGVCRFISSQIEYNMPAYTMSV